MAVEKIFLEKGIDTSLLNIAYCPERVLPGNVMNELISNDRVVGGLNAKSTRIVADFYRQFVEGNIFETDAKTAELCKLTENSFRDVNLAFANELSLICDKEKIDVWNLIKLANQHPRVDILAPGTGVGGHCIAVDPWFIIYGNQKNSELLQKSREINDSKPHWVAKKIMSLVKDKKTEDKENMTIACLGLAYKPNIDDLRSSPAVSVIEKLENSGCNVVAVEPNIAYHESIKLVSLQEAISQSDVVAVLVGHKEFCVEDINSKLRSIGALDFCGVLC